MAPNYIPRPPHFDIYRPAHYNRKGNVPTVPYTREQIVRNFKSFDMNGDGKLSKEEVKAAFAKLGSSWPDYRAWRGQSHADADSDGFISLDDELDELVNYTMKQKYPANSVI